MLDPNELAKIVEQQITSTVNDQVVEVLASKDWLEPLEQKVIKYSRDKILTKFANSSTMPEIIQAVKQGVAEMFDSGLIPGIENYIDQTSIKQAIDIAVQETIQSALVNLSQDPIWLEKIERMVNQAMVQRVVSQLGGIDISSIIHSRVTEIFNNKELVNFSSTGINDHASQVQLTIMDDTTVVENELTTRNLNVVGTTTVNDLIVKGSINTDNYSWNSLASAIKDKTLEELTDAWQNNLIKQVSSQIQKQGINFDQVTIDGARIIEGNSLGSTITRSNLQSVGALESLNVTGTASIGTALTITQNRIGINTKSPDSALSIWDEEISIIVGKHKSQESFIGTGRNQTIHLGINREPQLTITPDGLTSVKKLSIQQHQIAFSNQVPGWAGTRGDIVFNSNPNNDVFAWVCLGDYKWKVLKAVE